MFKSLLLLAWVLGITLYQLVSPVLIQALTPITSSSDTWWSIQSIDTMKYSRDSSREFLTSDKAYQIIDDQVRRISETGATHVAIATPYDEEFVPILKVWVIAARRYKLNVWFRGNWSGWEGWFDYPKIGREEHLTKTKFFILNHPELFVDGDLFSSCPECENGGPGDPRRTGDTDGFRDFITDEYKATSEAFATINKKVQSNLFAMNGDVAKLIMDKKTTAELDGVVVVDHYVSDPKKLVKDLQDLAAKSGGKVILGEFGAPIPDLHGQMTEAEQARWIKEVMEGLSQTPEVVGVNYWTGVGGSTRIWENDGRAHQAVKTLSDFFTPATADVQFLNSFHEPVSGIIIAGTKTKAIAKSDTTWSLVSLDPKQPISITAPGYQALTLVPGEITGTQPAPIYLQESNPTWLSRVHRFFKLVWITLRYR